MSQNYVMSLAKDTLTVIIMVGGPIMLAILIVGMAVSIFQALTQIQEQTLTFVPKLIAAAAVVAVLGPWMLRVLLSYTSNLFNSLVGLAKY